MSGVPRDLRRGTILALILGAACLLVARCGFGSLFQLGLLLSVAMMFLLLVAWIILLRADGCFHGAGPEGPPAPAPESGDGPRRYYAAFEDRLLERPACVTEPARTWTRQEVQRAMLWAALELGLASVAWYRWGGLGARMFR